MKCQAEHDEANAECTCNRGMSFVETLPLCFTENDRASLETELQGLVPFAMVKLSELGSRENASLLICLSLDAKDTWKNGYLENSRYARISIREKVQHFGGFGLSKFRAHNFKSLTATLAKLEKWINENQAEYKAKVEGVQL